MSKNEQTSVKSSQVIAQEAPPPGPLGRKELLAMSIGQTFGSGIITIIGVAIGVTGYSGWVSYLLAILFGFVNICPILFISSALRCGGGTYSLIGALAGHRVAGMSMIAGIPAILSLGMFGLALGSYVQSVIPAANPTLVGVLFLTAFYVINLLGVNVMAKAQKIMTWFLLAMMGMFIVVGMFHLKNPVFNVTAPDFLMNGPSGLMSAAVMLMFSTTAYSSSISHGRIAKNATKDIPWSMLMTLPIIIVFYGGAGIVAAGVLPLEQVAGQPLTYVARSILPTALFYLFLVGGPIMCLTTTLNSMMPIHCVNLAQGCRDGWFPKSWAAENKYGVTWKVMTFVYLMGILPLLLGYDISSITNNTMLVGSLVGFISIFGYYQMPKKFPNAWAKASLHMPNWAYYVMMTVSLLMNITVTVVTSLNLTPTKVIVSVVIVVLCALYAFVRSKSPDVSMQISVWED